MTKENIMSAMQKELNQIKTLTENGAVAYDTSGKALLDFNFSISAYRDADEQHIVNDFMKAFYNDPLTAIKYLFYVGDVREGLGERRTFRVIFKHLAETYPDIITSLVKYVAEYHRWDYVVDLCIYCHATEVSTEAFNIIKSQLNQDIEDALNNRSISLLAKWLPSENTSSKRTHFQAKVLSHALGYSPRIYRKILSKLRQQLDVVERKMSAKEWEQIDYNMVPSQANIKYADAFLRNDFDRRKEFLTKLAHGESDVKINAGTLFPHQIVQKYLNISGWLYGIKDLDTTLEELWKALPEHSLSNTLVIRDGSGSMTEPDMIPYNVATALAIYMAEHNTGFWKDKYITFSSNPEIVDQSNIRSLRDKIALATNYRDISNTDIYKTMRLILDAAINNHLTQDDMPTNIVICSDMQFDAHGCHYNQTLFEQIQDEYQQNGFLLPRIIFWNLAATPNHTHTIPIQQNDLGMALISGFSLQLLQMVMSNTIDPYQALLNVIDSDRYKPIEDAIRAQLQLYFY